MKTLFTTQEEYYSYIYTANRQNRIHRFWIDQIVRKMPEYLHKEVRKKPTVLMLQGPDKFNITGVEPYQFVTKYPSDELFDYLSKFVIFVENPTKWTKIWRTEVKGMIKEMKANK